MTHPLAIVSRRASHAEGEDPWPPGTHGGSSARTGPSPGRPGIETPTGASGRRSSRRRSMPNGSWPPPGPTWRGATGSTRRTPSACSLTSRSTGEPRRFTPTRPRRRSPAISGTTSSPPSATGRSAGSGTPDVQAWVRRLSERLAPATVDRSYRWLAAIFRLAVNDDLIRRSPCFAIKLPVKPDARVEPLRREDVEALLEALPARYRALAVIGAGAGLRQGEAFGLTVPNIDFLRG